MAKHAAGFALSRLAGKLVTTRKRREKLEVLERTGKALAQEVKNVFVRSASPDQRAHLTIRHSLHGVVERYGSLKFKWRRLLIVDIVSTGGNIALENIKEIAHKQVREFVQKEACVDYGIVLRFHTQ